MTGLLTEIEWHTHKKNGCCFGKELYTANEIPPNRTLFRLFLSLSGLILSSGIVAKKLFFRSKYLYLEISVALCRVKNCLYFLLTTIGDAILLRRGSFLSNKDFPPE